GWSAGDLERSGGPVADADAPTVGEPRVARERVAVRPDGQALPPVTLQAHECTARRWRGHGWSAPGQPIVLHRPEEERIAEQRPIVLELDVPQQEKAVALPLPREVPRVKFRDRKETVTRESIHLRIVPLVDHVRAGAIAVEVESRIS